LFTVTMYGGLLSDELLGLTDYYGAILSRSGLAKRECEFRTNKLSLILDFIRTIGIPENVKTELSSAIIDAWRLQVPEQTLKQREEELKMVVGSLNSIKSVAKWMEICKGMINASQINFKVLSDLPISPTDLRSEDVPRIYDMLKQVRECCISITDGNLCLIPEASHS
jgi:hypothetical protein